MIPTGVIDRTAAGGRVRAALEAAAEALERVDFDGLLAAEDALAAALGECARLTPGGPAGGEALRAEVDGARRALMRCRRLGASLGEFTRASFDARGGAIDYDPARAVASNMTGRGFQTRG